jgi:acyl carrier protein
MTRSEFVIALAEELELEVEINESTDLKGLDDWDSMAAMILIGFVSNTFDVNLNADDIKEISTIETLINKIGIEKFSS